MDFRFPTADSTHQTACATTVTDVHSTSNAFNAQPPAPDVASRRRNLTHVLGAALLGIALASGCSEVKSVAPPTESADENQANEPGSGSTADDSTAGEATATEQD